MPHLPGIVTGRYALGWSATPTPNLKPPSPTALSKAERPAADADVVLSVEIGTAADVSALLVPANDFVFFNQPTAPACGWSRCRPGATAHQHRQVPAEIDDPRRDHPRRRVVVARGFAPTARAAIPPTRAVFVPRSASCRRSRWSLPWRSTAAIPTRRRTAVGPGYAGGFARTRSAITG